MPNTKKQQEVIKKSQDLIIAFPNYKSKYLVLMIKCNTWLSLA